MSGFSVQNVASVAGGGTKRGDSGRLTQKASEVKHNVDSLGETTRGKNSQESVWAPGTKYATAKHHSLHRDIISDGCGSGWAGLPRLSRPIGFIPHWGYCPRVYWCRVCGRQQRMGSVWSWPGSRSRPRSRPKRAHRLPTGLNGRISYIVEWHAVLKTDKLYYHTAAASHVCRVLGRVSSDGFTHVVVRQREKRLYYSWPVPAGLRYYVRGVSRPNGTDSECRPRSYGSALGQRLSISMIRYERSSTAGLGHRGQATLPRPDGPLKTSRGSPQATETRKRQDGRAASETRVAIRVSQPRSGRSSPLRRAQGLPTFRRRPCPL